MTNILILSCGTRNKVIQYFRKALDGKGKVIAADRSTLAPALYDADKYYILPGITDPDYLNRVLEICKTEQVNGVLSLIDPELTLLARHSDVFIKNGVQVIGSSVEACERSFDKFIMYQWMAEHQYPCALTFDNGEDFFLAEAEGRISYPVFIKPVRGSASVNVTKANDCATVEWMLSHYEDLIIQESLTGQEIGADVYVDIISGEVVSIFLKKKLLMRAGETDKAVSYKEEHLFAFIERFVLECGFKGPIDIDLFDENGKWYISEVNPRFGGGYPLAYECGCDHMKLIVNNLQGLMNEKQIGRYESGVYMMKYNDVEIQRFPNYSSECR